MAFSFKIEKVANCPKSRQSKGIVRMPPSLIAMLATAVEDKDEWAIICSGTRSERGYLVEVTSYRLPPQTRSSGHVEIEEFDLNPDDVLVIHSHHSMGAFFSTTDTDKLNPRFPTSIVVAHGANTFLGFNYKGTGKVTLPCGSIAEIPFGIQPTDGPEIATWAEVDHNATDLGDCNKFEDKAADSYHVHYHAACGLTKPLQLRAAAFGKNDELLKEVAVLPRPIHVYSGGNLSARKNGIYEMGKGGSTNGTNTKAAYCPKCDFEFKSRGGPKLYCSGCKEWVKVISAKKRQKRQDSKFSCPDCNHSFESSTLRSDGTLVCPTCKKDVTPRQGGSAGGWLKKYEGQPVDYSICTHAATKNGRCLACTRLVDCLHPVTVNDLCQNCGADVTAVTDVIPELVWCDECGFYSNFADWNCEACRSPYCQACDCGHNGPCSETARPPTSSIKLCPCKRAVAEADGYCSAECKAAFEVEVEGEFSETILYFCPCGTRCGDVGYCSFACFNKYDSEGGRCPCGANVSVGLRFCGRPCFERFSEALDVEELKSQGEDLGDGCVKVF